MRHQIDDEKPDKIVVIGKCDGMRILSGSHGKFAVGGAAAVGTDKSRRAAVADSSEAYLDSFTV